MSSTSASADRRWVAEAFPSAEYDDAVALGPLLPHERFKPSYRFVVSIGGEEVAIPYRIYGAELDDGDLAALSTSQRIIMHCLYTRHHDGRVRQRHLRLIVGELRPWIAPFVVQLVGEYVADILLDIRDGLVEVDVSGTDMHAMYGRFGAANPEFIALTRQRVASYWNCYYRNSWADRSYYPGTTVIESLRAASRQFDATK
ncbi:hypothetical protein OHA21_16165 [Actinoplanes sp. NBC_00393]|uniref:hypothetical protein n=1 Tax=Actinoplanes sp. NBC_00393 TaxID=2975953 RepID=UPI002E1F33A0